MVVLGASVGTDAFAAAEGLRAAEREQGLLDGRVSTRQTTSGLAPPLLLWRAKVQLPPKNYSTTAGETLR